MPIQPTRQIRSRLWTLLVKLVARALAATPTPLTLLASVHSIDCYLITPMPIDQPPQLPPIPSPPVPSDPSTLLDITNAIKFRNDVEVGRKTDHTSLESLTRAELYLYDVMRNHRRDDVSGLRTLLEQVSQNVITLMADVTGIKTDVAAVKADVAAVKVDGAAVKADVAALKVDVAAVKADVAALKADVAAMKLDITAVKAEVTTVKAGLTTIRDMSIDTAIISAREHNFNCGDGELRPYVVVRCPDGQLPGQALPPLRTAQNLAGLSRRDAKAYCTAYGLVVPAGPENIYHKAIAVYIGCLNGL